MSTDTRADTFEEDTRRLLQQRLWLTFSVLAGVSVFYAVSEVLQTLVPGGMHQSPTLVTLLTALVGVAMVVLAWRCRGPLRAARELSALDAGAMALVCWVMAGSMTQVRPTSEGAASIVLGATYIFMARAVLLRARVVARLGSERWRCCRADWSRRSCGSTHSWSRRASRTG